MIQSYFRGRKARKMLRELKYQKRCSEAVTTIAAYWHGTQARRQLKRMKEEARNAEARRKIYNFTVKSIIQKYFLGLRNTMPSESPTDNNWPASPYVFLNSTHEKIKRIFHLWRCKKYREEFKEEKKIIYEEKLVASEIFKDKKSLYPASVGQAFQGDYLETTKHPKYQKLRDAIKEDIILADTVTKIHRSNGKSAMRIILLTKQHLIIADNKTGKIKLKIPLGDITKLSITSKTDDFFAVHLKENSAAARKGDFLFSSTHIIEFATKLYRTALIHTQHKIHIDISNIFLPHFEQRLVCVKFVKGNVTIPTCKWKVRHLLIVTLP